MSLTFNSGLLTTGDPYGCLANILTHLRPPFSSHFIISSQCKRSLSFSANDFLFLPHRDNVFRNVPSPSCFCAGTFCLLSCCTVCLPELPYSHLSIPFTHTWTWLQQFFLLHQQLSPLYSGFFHHSTDMLRFLPT